MTTRGRIRLSISSGLLLSTLAVLATGCATPARPKGPAVFFPDPPALARIQFLTSFNGLRDIEEESGFERFVVGEKQNLQLDKPYGVAIHDGKIYVCDTNTTVIVLDLKKKRFGPMPGIYGKGRLVQPVNISIEPDGTKYVSDPGRGQVVVFDAKDEFVRALGKPGDWKPIAAVARGSRLYVVDGEHLIVKIVDKVTGEPLATVGDKGERSERLGRPTNLAFDSAGDLYVSDMGRFQVVRFDQEGKFKGTIGRLGDSLGEFARPKGIAFDSQDRLYAVDAAFNNLQLFDRDGRLLMFFGARGEEPGGLLLPAQVAIDTENMKYFEQYLDPGFDAQYLVLVTSQFGNRRVNVFAFGKEKGKTYPSDDELRKELEQKSQKESEKPPGR